MQLLLNYSQETDENKETVGRAQRLFQYCQLPSKNSRNILRYFGGFYSVSKLLSFYSTVPCADPVDVWRRPCRKTLY